MAFELKLLIRWLRLRGGRLWLHELTESGAIVSRLA